MNRLKNFFEKLPATGMLLMTMILATVAISCDDDDDTPGDNRPYTISGNATGDQVVPSVTGTGSATITGTYNPQTRQLEYTSNWADLTGAPTSGGFYTGARGSSGTTAGAPWTIAAGSTGTGTTNGSMTLTEEQAKQFLAGGWYYSYGTATNPGGEVRGQVSASR